MRARPLSSAASQRGAPARTSLRPWRPASPTRKAAPAAREPRAARAWGPGGGEVNWTPRRTQPGSGERSAVGDRRRGRAGGGALSPRAGSGERGPGRDLERRARSTGLEEAPGGGLSRVVFRGLPRQQPRRWSGRWQPCGLPERDERRCRRRSAAAGLEPTGFRGWSLAGATARDAGGRAVSGGGGVEGDQGQRGSSGWGGDGGGDS